MGQPRPLNELVNEELMNGQTFDEFKEEFNLEDTIRYLADILRMDLQMKRSKEILVTVNILSYLGIELEDLKFVGNKEMNYIAGLMMNQ